MRSALALLLVAGAPCGGSQEKVQATGPFAYDADAPLDVRESDSSRPDDLTIHGVTYASPKGGRVPALVVVPRGDGPFAGLIVQHGLPGSRMDMLPYALDFTRLGAVVVLIDAPFTRRPGEPVRRPATSGRRPSRRTCSGTTRGTSCRHRQCVPKARWRAEHIGTTPDHPAC